MTAIIQEIHFIERETLVWSPFFSMWEPHDQSNPVTHSPYELAQSQNSHIQWLLTLGLKSFKKNDAF